MSEKSVKDYIAEAMKDAVAQHEREMAMFFSDGKVFEYRNPDEPFGWRWSYRTGWELIVVEPLTDGKLRKALALFKKKGPPPVSVFG